MTLLLFGAKYSLHSILVLVQETKMKQNTTRDLRASTESARELSHNRLIVATNQGKDHYKLTNGREPGAGVIYRVKICSNF